MLDVLMYRKKNKNEIHQTNYFHLPLLDINSSSLGMIICIPKSGDVLFLDALILPEPVKLVALLVDSFFQNLLLLLFLGVSNVLSSSAK